MKAAAASACLILLLLSPRPLSAADFALKGGEKIVFFGDSITQSGQYIHYVEAYLRTRFPDRQFELINHGISSETISGTSEPDHDPRRPHADVRFTRDVAALHPDVVVACFGMNDGNYYPFEPERFAAYQAGVRRLIARTRDEAQARLVLLTPPPFDPYRRKPLDPEAVTFGYKFPAIDYDHTLTEYSRWLTTLRSDSQIVGDIHAASLAHLEARRKQKVSFTLAPDAVHPNSTGHWLMAQTLLLALGAPADAVVGELDATTREVRTAAIREVKAEGDTLSFTWKAGLPMPFDPTWDGESIAMEKVADRLNRCRLKVTGLKAGRYSLAVEGRKLADVDSAACAEGINLLEFDAWPGRTRADEVLKLVQERQGLQYQAWRREIGRELSKATMTTEEIKDRVQTLDERLHELCRPAELHWTLTPVR